MSGFPLVFLWNTIYILRTTDKLWNFKLGYRADIFLQMNKVSLSPQGRQLTPFVANYKNLRFQKKLKFQNKNKKF
jgi:hypothetical protein